MRKALLVVFTVAGLVGVLSAGETYPKTMKVVRQDAEVRDGPFKGSRALARLLRGDEVTVLQVVDADWYAIKPPAGSFSWVQSTHLKIVDRAHGFIDVGKDKKVPLYAGSKLVNTRPKEVSLWVTNGTIVMVVENPLTVDGETWYPIHPHRDEVRYVHSSSVGVVKDVPRDTEMRLRDEIDRLHDRIESLEKRLEKVEKRKRK